MRSSSGIHQLPQKTQDLPAAPERARLAKSCCNSIPQYTLISLAMRKFTKSIFSRRILVRPNLPDRLRPKETLQMQQQNFWDDRFSMTKRSTVAWIVPWHRHELRRGPLTANYSKEVNVSRTAIQLKQTIINKRHVIGLRNYDFWAVHKVFATYRRSIYYDSETPSDML